jgi:hypothetical protein
MSVAELSQEAQEFEDAFAANVKPAEAPKKTDPVVPKEPEEPKAAAPEATPAPKEQQPPDTVESMKRERDEALHRERSSANRISHFKRESTKHQEQVASLTAEVAALKAQAKPAPKPEEADQHDMLEDAPDLKAAVERRIERATKGLREELSAANSKLAEVDQTANRAAQSIEPLVGREDERVKQSTRAELDKLFPSWQGDINTPKFQEWLKQQLVQIRNLYKEGKTVAECSSVLKLFYADKGVPKVDPAPSAKSLTDAARLQNAGGISPRAAVRTAAGAEDFDGAFAEFATKKP